MMAIIMNMVYQVEDFLFCEDRDLIDVSGGSGSTLLRLRIVTDNYSAVTNDGYAGCSFSLIVASANHHVAYFWLV